ncbi:MAG: archaeosortase H [Promethearchaeota archaeon]
MGKIEYENNYYDFDWLSVIILFVGAPIIALTVWFSHDWIWLHRITAELTKVLLNLITGTNSVVLFNTNPNFATTPYYFQIDDVNNYGLGRIYFESLCTGVHAIAIFTAVILCIPSSSDPEIKRTIWMRKFWAILVTSVIFYLVNVLRMILQLYLYQNGSLWDDIHYPISSASSFIAVACVLVMHKFVPEFIMLLIWMGDEIKALRRKPEDDLESIPSTEDPEMLDADLVENEPIESRFPK